MEIKVRVETYKVYLKCDECKGFMIPNGICLASNPPQYPHVCDNCGNVQNIMGKRYPFIEYKEIETFE